jgi:hypothetical protein
MPLFAPMISLISSLIEANSIRLFQWFGAFKSDFGLFRLVDRRAGHPPRSTVIDNLICLERIGSSKEEIGNSEPIVQFMPSGVDNNGLSNHK